jgi:apolipoprotein D and lipocalin family protein
VRGLTLAGLLALAACGAAEPAARTAWRNPAAAISSSTAFDPARFAGRWAVVAAYGAEAACGALAEDWQATAPGRFAVRGESCAGGRKRGFLTEARLTGPGRMQRGGPGGTEELWLLWVDADYRVAVVGTPSGRFGRILARDWALRADLAEAARRVLDFNGYDISGLRAAR